MALSFLYCGFIISAAKIAMYLNKLSGMEYTMRILDYVEPLEILFTVFAIIISLIVVYLGKD